MPNTFIHLGVQAVCSRALWKEADFKWIAAGCIIPDIPWIAQRLLLGLDGLVDPYALRFYVIVQASLLFCLLLSGAIALLVRDSRKVFFLLALNCLLHLLIDATELKWANGVHLLAPFSWQTTNFGLLWPEHPASYLLTLLGVLALGYYGARDWQKQVYLSTDSNNSVLSVLLLAAYLSLPLVFSAGSREADNHFAATLQAVEKRPGRYVELGRVPLRRQDNTVVILNGERIKLQGLTAPKDAFVSLQGHFVDTGTIHVSALHVHSPLRDLSTMAALAGVLSLWLVAFVKKRITLQ